MAASRKGTAKSAVATAATTAAATATAVALCNRGVSYGNRDDAN
jgi:hypothetical protein